MQLDQFLDKLAMTPRHWYLDDLGGIRMRDIETRRLHCPLSWVGKEMGIQYSPIGAEYGCKVGMAMGLSEHTSGRIVYAADNPSRGTPLRRQLMEACGLTSTGDAHG